MSEEPDVNLPALRQLLDGLIGQFGLDGLHESLRAAMRAIESGQISGPAIDDALAWLQATPAGMQLSGEGRLTLDGMATSGIVVNITDPVGLTDGLGMSLESGGVGNV